MIGTYTYVVARNFGSILISQINGSTGTLNALALYQNATSASTYASWINSSLKSRL